MKRWFKSLLVGAVAAPVAAFVTIAVLDVRGKPPEIHRADYSVSRTDAQGKVTASGFEGQSIELRAADESSRPLEDITVVSAVGEHALVLFVHNDGDDHVPELRYVPRDEAAGLQEIALKEQRQWEVVVQIVKFPARWGNRVGANACPVAPRTDDCGRLGASSHAMTKRRQAAALQSCARVHADSRQWAAGRPVPIMDARRAAWIPAPRSGFLRRRRAHPLGSARREDWDQRDGPGAVRHGCGPVDAGPHRRAGTGGSGE